jgi:UDP-N-acetylmuramate--alanine ligase
MPGRHNIDNALAAAAAASAAGAPRDALAEGLNRFAGIRRRMEACGSIRGVRWIDDYAHHPTEVAAGLATARSMCPRGRVWCVFQPHQHSRTRRLQREFAQTLQKCDRLLLAEIFRARELSSVDEFSVEQLAALVRQGGGRVEPSHGQPQILDRLAQAIAQRELTPGDILITMGAGNVGQLGALLAARLGREANGTIRTAG